MDNGTLTSSASVDPQNTTDVGNEPNNPSGDHQFPLATRTKSDIKCDSSNAPSVRSKTTVQAQELLYFIYPGPTCMELKQVKPIVTSTERENHFHRPTNREFGYCKPYEEPNTSYQQSYTPQGEHDTIHQQISKPNYQQSHDKPSASYQQNCNNRTEKIVDSPPPVSARRGYYEYGEPQYQQFKPDCVERQHNISHQSHHGNNIPQEIGKYSHSSPRTESTTKIKKINTSRTSTKVRQKDSPQKPSKRFPSWTDMMSSVYGFLAGGDDSQDTSQESQEGPMLLTRKSSRHKMPSRKQSTRPVKRGRSNDSKRTKESYGWFSHRDVNNEDALRPTFVFVKRAKIFMNDKQSQAKSRSSSWEMSLCEDEPEMWTYRKKRR
ncbi:hypothetical protein WDU94_015055 [Cyamophila willieti]